MSLKEKLKKRFLSDALVILIIFIGVAGFSLISQRNSVWKVNKHEEINGEEKEITRYVQVRDRLDIYDSEVQFKSEYENHLGIVLEGDASLKLDNSEIYSKNSKWALGAFDEARLHPSIELIDSQLRNHSRIVLKGASELSMKNSEIEEVIMYDDSVLKAEDSTLTPVLFSSKKETYKDLQSGESVKLDLESNEGWRMDLTNCEVDAFLINLIEDDQVKIVDSNGIVLNTRISQNSEESGISRLTSDVPTSGELTGFGYDFSWENTLIEGLNVIISGGVTLNIDNTYVSKFVVEDSSEVSLKNLDIRCGLCTVSDGSKLILNNVKVENLNEGLHEDAVINQVLNIGYNSEVEIRDSDLGDLKIKLSGRSKLKLINTVINKENIEIDQGSELIEQ